MNILDLIKLTLEAERYPALLAWYQHITTSNSEQDMAYLIRCLGNDPEEEGVDIFELYDRYLERGEIGAAQFLLRRYQTLSPAKTIHRKALLTQQINEAILSVREAIHSLNETCPSAGQEYAKQLDTLCNESLTMDYRPGLVLQALGAVNAQLQETLEKAGTPLIPRPERHSL
jgi:hypothetical protein